MLHLVIPVKDIALCHTNERCCTHRPSKGCHTLLYTGTPRFNHPKNAANVVLKVGWSSVTGTFTWTYYGKVSENVV